MSRITIPDEIQCQILMRSRRRCCLCFWLKGRDEVQKGQIAHLDQDSSNASEDNLAFLCFDHHDEYDGTPRLSKGLRKNETKKYRNELYREMEYRFSQIKTYASELTIIDFRCLPGTDRFTARFRLKNTGDAPMRSPHVLVELPPNVAGKKPREFIHMNGGFRAINPVDTDAGESIQDVFQQDGRVMTWKKMGLDPLLLPGHAVRFEAMRFLHKKTPPGTSLDLRYRVDCENGPSMVDTIHVIIPKRDEMRQTDEQPWINKEEV